MQKTVDAPKIPHNVPLPLNSFRGTSLAFLLNNAIRFCRVERVETYWVRDFMSIIIFAGFFYARIE